MVYRVDQRQVKNNQDPRNIRYVLSAATIPFRLPVHLYMYADQTSFVSFRSIHKEQEVLGHDEAFLMYLLATPDTALFKFIFNRVILK